jgi:hypothetical protein
LNEPRGQVQWLMDKSQAATDASEKASEHANETAAIFFHAEVLEDSVNLEGQDLYIGKLGFGRLEPFLLY